MERSMTRILFVATEDWFMRSHFLPLIAAARARGWQPMVAARMGDAAADLTRAGAELYPLSGARGRMGPLALAAQAAELRRVVQRAKPDLIHAIALKPAALTAVAAPRTALVLAITGFGFLAGSREPMRQALRGAASSVLAFAAKARGARLVFENAHDQRKFVKRGVPVAHCFIAPGAGIDATGLIPIEEPALPPIRVGFAARLLKIKGVDQALEAFDLLHARGEAIELLIAGAPDPDNPASYSEADVAAWNARPNVKCLGKVTNIRDLWAQSHIAIVPSLGGEGMPKSMLEAAACGRAIIASDAPGCRDFLANGEGGLVVPRGDGAALADAISKLAQNTALRQKLGAGARRAIERGYTVKHVTDVMERAWDAALAAR